MARHSMEMTESKRLLIQTFVLRRHHLTGAGIRPDTFGRTHVSTIHVILHVNDSGASQGPFGIANHSRLHMCGCRYGVMPKPKCTPWKLVDAGTTAHASCGLTDRT